MNTHATASVSPSVSTSRRGRSSGSRRCRRTATVSSTAAAATLTDSKVRRTGAEVALDSNDLVIVGAELHAETGPCVEVGSHVDGAGRALALADRPELLEGRGALDGRSVGTLVGVDVVDAAVDSDRSLLGGAGAGVVGAEVFDNIILNQRVFLGFVLVLCKARAPRFQLTVQP